MKQIITSILLLANLFACSQAALPKINGIYSDNITNLELHGDSTFVLKTPDYVYPYTYNCYQNKGKWTISDKVIILNPDKSRRAQVVAFTEKSLAGADSIEIKINYQTELYENEMLVKREPADFNLMTLYLNKPANYRHLVHAPVIRNCTFAPKVKRQYVVDSSNTIRLPKQKVEKIGIYTYGFDKTVELLPQNPNANYFELNIIQPVDKERVPRGKRVIIKGSKAYFYEQDGKVLTSGLLLNPLRRIH